MRDVGRDMLLPPEVHYFQITAWTGVRYPTSTTAIFQRLQCLIYQYMKRHTF